MQMMWFVKIPVHMVHHVQCGGNILVESWFQQIFRHVVQEVDVSERPAGVILGLWTHLEIMKIEVKKDQWEWLVACGPTSAIISAQLLCFRGTITSSTSSRAIQSYLFTNIV